MREGNLILRPNSSRHLLITGSTLQQYQYRQRPRHRAIKPQIARHVHPFTQYDASSELDKIEGSVQIVRLPGHFIERSGNDAENGWRGGDLYPEHLTFRIVIRLD